MPYKSDKQRAFMHAKHPKIASRWDKEYGGKVVSDEDEKEHVEDGREDMRDFMEGGNLESKVLDAIMSEMDEYESDNKLKPLMVKVDIVGGKNKDMAEPGEPMEEDEDEDEFSKLLKSKMR